MGQKKKTSIHHINQNTSIIILTMSNFSSGQSCTRSPNFICSVWRKLFKKQANYLRKRFNINFYDTLLNLCLAHLPVKVKKIGISKLHGKIMDRLGVIRRF